MRRINKFGLIGIGKMGHAMAQRGLDLGDSVHVWNRRNTPSMNHIVKQGALAASSLEELFSHTDNIILTLGDDQAINEVVHNIEIAFMSGLERGTLNYKKLEEKYFIDCSSTCPNLTRRIAASFKTKYGARWLDAPVSGGPPSALQGKLAMMVGGNKSDVAKVSDILLKFTPRIHYVGESGAGQKAKLSNQIILCCFFLAAAEAVRFSEAVFGDSMPLAPALNQGNAKSRFLEVFAPRMINRNYHEALGSVSILLKSLMHINGLTQNNSHFPFVNHMQKFFEEAAKAGHQDKEPSLFVDFFPKPLKIEPRSVSSFVSHKLCADVVISSLVPAIIEAMKLAKILGIDFNLSEVFKNGFADSELLQSVDRWRKEKDTASLNTVGELINSIKEIRKIADQLNLAQPFFEGVENYFQTRISQDDANRHLAELINLLAESTDLVKNNPSLSFHHQG